MSRGIGAASIAASIAAIVALAAGPAGADSAQTLPRGVVSASIAPTFVTFDERYGAGGDREQLTHDLDGVRLDSSVFPDLAGLERAYNMPAGALDVGESHLRSRVTIEALAVSVQLGVLDWLSVGVGAPVVSVQNRLGVLALDPGNIGRNPGDTWIKPTSAEYLPVDHDKDPRTRDLAPLTREDVIEILRDDFGYAPLDDYSGTGLGDLEAGAKARVFARGRGAGALSLGLRAPTGQVAPIHDILGVGIGAGCWAPSLAAHLDVAPARRVRANATVRYTAQLPAWRELRIPRRVDRPITDLDSIEEVWRDLGDVLALDLSASFAAHPTLAPFVRYVATWKGRDEVRGNRGLAYESLEELTDARNHVVAVGAAYSTVPLYRRGAFAVPLDVGLSLEQSVAGRNRALSTTLIGLSVTGYYEVW